MWQIVIKPDILPFVETFKNESLPMTFDHWMKIGIEYGFCGPICCITHDGEPLSPDEEQEFEEGGDPCVSMLRVYENIEQKQAIEGNHSPSVWRNLQG